MNKTAIKTMLLVMIAIVSLVMVAQIAWTASIVGTKHDMSSTGSSKLFGTGGSANAGTDVCVYCHTPHSASTTQLVPLWSHASTAATFTLYTSSTLNAVVSQPQGVSKACLSCHDGTVAVDSYKGATGVNTIPVGSTRIGTDLTNDHPISFDYALAQGLDAGLKTKVAVTGAGLKLFGSAGNDMECASCHSVHDNTNDPFLRVANTASALCIACHNK